MHVEAALDSVEERERSAKTTADLAAWSPVPGGQMQRKTLQAYKREVIETTAFVLLFFEGWLQNVTLINDTEFVILYEEN